MHVSFEVRDWWAVVGRRVDLIIDNVLDQVHIGTGQPLSEALTLSYISSKK